MAAGTELTPSQYIQHHLTFFQKPVGEGGGFWTINVDSVVTAVLLGVVGFGFLWWVVRGATAGVPNKRQAFVELLIQFIDVLRREGRSDATELKLSDLEESSPTGQEASR